MQTGPSKKLYVVTIEFYNGQTRDVNVRAATREAAERRALKFHPTAKGVKK